MKEYKDTATTASHCLECGHELGYGRKDRKFCSDHCRHTFNNHRRSGNFLTRDRVHSKLDRNHGILSRLLDCSHVTSIPLAEIRLMGFNECFVTSSVDTGYGREYACYDIAFRIGKNKIFNIRRMSLPLPSDSAYDNDSEKK